MVDIYYFVAFSWLLLLVYLLFVLVDV